MNAAGSYTISGITPSEQNKQTKPKDYLFALCVGVILIVTCWLGTWSEHFRKQGFHFDDIPAVVTNSPSLSHLSNALPQFFANQRTFNVTKENLRLPAPSFHVVPTGLQDGR